MARGRPTDKLIGDIADVQAVFRSGPNGRLSPFGFLGTRSDSAALPVGTVGRVPLGAAGRVVTSSQFSSEDTPWPNAQASPPTSMTIGRGGETHQSANKQHPVLTTNQGIPISDNQNSLKVAERGPTLLEDFVLREKITHFDHERIPERIVHARGSAAHGYFECYKPLSAYTKAEFLQRAGEKTRVFVRFSTVAGGAGSVDLPRDVRGFAVKFYTNEGNFDLVGNNIPVFFIQDAMKFPDLVHSVKMEPDRGFPQAASAHDTFWDFISLMPESMHMIMWAMSDRAIPRSLRMIEGFGVNTFRLVNAKDQATFVKFHWRPKLGLQSVVWDEAVKISGADPDFHRRDLWTAIDSGNFPEWELGLQIFDQKQAGFLRFRRARRHQADPGRAGAAEDRRRDGARTATPTISSPRPSRSRSARPISCRASISATIRCCRGGCSPISTRSSSAWAGRTSTRSRSTSRCVRCAISSATGICGCRCRRAASTTSPTRSPADGPRECPEQGFRSFERPASGNTVRLRPESFADHYSPGAPVLPQPDRAGAEPHRLGAGVRAQQGRDAGDPRARGLASAEHREGAGRAGGQGPAPAVAAGAGRDGLSGQGQSRPVAGA